jgi:hypothetical protein
MGWWCIPCLNFCARVCEGEERGGVLCEGEAGCVSGVWGGLGVCGIHDASVSQSVKSVGEMR